MLRRHATALYYTLKVKRPIPKQFVSKYSLNCQPNRTALAVFVMPNSEQRRMYFSLLKQHYWASLPFLRHFHPFLPISVYSKARTATIAKENTQVVKIPESNSERKWHSGFYKRPRRGHHYTKDDYFINSVTKISQSNFKTLNLLDDMAIKLSGL